MEVNPIEASFLTCLLDDMAIPIEESKNYQNALKYYGPDFANQLVVEYVVKLKDDDT